MLRFLRERVAKDRIKPATLSLERTYLNKFFEWCKVVGYAKENPLDPIPTVPIPKVNRQTITDEQYRKLKEAAQGTHWSGMVVAGWTTGARISDVACMRWWNGYEGVNLDTKLWVFTPIKTRRTGLAIELPIFGELFDELKIRYDTRDSREPYVFPEAHILWVRGDGSIQDDFRKVRDKTDLPTTISFHSLRHTRASRMLNSTDSPVDAITVANILGLASLDTLRRYTHTGIAKKEQGMKL